MSDLYLKINKSLWDKLAAVHVDTVFYDLDNFKKGKSSLNPIELNQLGNIKGKSLLHLQCHFGQDTLSLARMGANVTGIDLSDVAIRKAKSLARELALDATFVCCDVFKIDQHLNETYDLIFTSYGTIGWLPELDTWARLIKQFLKPGGAFHLIEFHPVMWMYDDKFSKIDYSYFNRETIIEEVKNSYADPNAKLTEQAYSWNHSLSEVISALLDHKLSITQFMEYNFSPYDIFADSVKTEEGFQIKGLENKMPLVYSLVAKNSV